MAMVHDPGDAGFVELLQLFHDELAEIQFPGADSSVLDEAQRWVEACREDLERCEAALERARAALSEAHDVRFRKAHRALSYARIYAEDDPTLLARLGAITLARHRPTHGATAAEPTMFAMDGEAGSKPGATGSARRKTRSARAEPTPLLPSALVAGNADVVVAGTSRDAAPSARVHKTDATASEQTVWVDLAAAV